MPETETKELTGRQPRTTVSAPQWLAVPVGVLFVAAGAGIVLFAAGRIGSPADANVPQPVLLPFGLVCAVLGAALLLFSAREALRKARLLRSAPHTPWLADYGWNPRGARDETLPRAAQAIWFAAFLSLFLLPFNYIVLFEELPLVGLLLFAIVTGVFDLIALGIFFYGLYLIVRRIRHGPATLRFEHFPFFLGEWLDVRLRLGAARVRRPPLRAALRCIQESYERPAPDDDTTTVCYQLYCDSQELPAAVAPGEGGRTIPIRFQLPDGDLSTQLAERPPRYWELELEGEDPGLGYGATFLVPVYARVTGLERTGGAGPELRLERAGQELPASGAPRTASRGP